MKRAGFYLLAILFIESSGTSAGSKVTDPVNDSFFEATTPLGIPVKKMLGITADDKHEMLKWNLTLTRATKNTPSAFKLLYEYGIPKQGTRGFMEGSKKVELIGNWVIEKGTTANNAATVVRLSATGVPVSLSFLQADENILHLLDENKNLMIGNGAWSYTLNRKDPVPQNKIIRGEVLTSQILAVNDTVGIFEGRTPCNDGLTKINNISLNGCQAIKCQLILLQNVNTHSPATFILKTVYVGKGDNRYTTTGKWKMLRGKTSDPATIIYQLEPEAAKSGTPISLLKGDDNILFFLDPDGRLLVGNNYCSYTLNKKR